MNNWLNKQHFTRQQQCNAAPHKRKSQGNNSAKQVKFIVFYRFLNSMSKLPEKKRNAYYKGKFL